jgi:hypothetical protein
MCMTAAVSLPGLVLVASDMRWSDESTDPPRRADLGGRLVRTPYGWACAAGWVHEAIPALDAVARGVDPAAALRASRVEDASWTTLLIVRDDGGLLEVKHGSERSATFGHQLSPPADLDHQQQLAINQQLGADVQACCDPERGLVSVPGVIAAVARAFVRAHTAPGVLSMSSDVELGITNIGEPHFLGADAAQLAEMPPDLIRARLALPPNLSEIRAIWRHAAAAGFCDFSLIEELS